MDINGISEVTAPVGYDGQTASSSTSKAVQQAPASKETEPADRILDKEGIKKMVEDMQSDLGGLNVNVEFSTYGKNNDQVSIVIMEKDSGKVIREIPSKEIQNLYSKMTDLAGLLFQNKA